MPRPRKARAEEDRGQTTRRAQARPVKLPGYEGKLFVPAKNKDPAFDYRWVRSFNRNQPDQNNVRDAMGRGWAPVSRAEWPEFNRADMTAIFGEDKSSTVIDGGGLIYMKRAKTLGAIEREGLRQANLQAIRSVRRDVMDPHGDRQTPVIEESQTHYNPMQEQGDFKRE